MGTIIQVVPTLFYIAITTMKISKLSIFTLFFIIIATQAMKSQPSQTITPIKESAHTIFDFAQQDFTYHNRNYRLYIAVPKTEHSNTPSPILYMMDGNGQFPMLINQVDSVNANSAIVVGIGYPNHEAYPKERTRDYTTPSQDNSQGGGAEDFYNFIVTEVRPYIESHYNIDTTHQTLCGHSFAGLFTLYVMLHHTTDFQHYVSASPSLWWDKGAVVPNSRPLFAHKPTSITITLGEYEENPQDDPARKNLSPKLIAQKDARVGGISARELHAIIANEVDNSKFIIYKGENHGSSIRLFLKDAWSEASRK